MSHNAHLDVHSSNAIDTPFVLRYKNVIWPDPVLEPGNESLRTDYITESDVIENPRSVKWHLFLPRISEKWTLSDLLVLVNEVPPDFTPDRIRWKSDDYYPFQVTYFGNFACSLKPTSALHIYVSSNGRKIQCRVSNRWLERDWIPMSGIFKVNKDLRNRTCRETEHAFIRYSRETTFYFNGSKILTRPDPLSCVAHQEYSAKFGFFLRELISYNIGSQQKHIYIKCLYHTIYTQSPALMHNHHRQEPEKMFYGLISGGIIHFDIQPRDNRDKAEEWRWNNQSVSIMAGYYVSSYAESLIANGIDGFMMDTTWNVMLQYVTSILVIVKVNTVIPVAFAFGPTECQELYESFFTAFNRLGINLGNYPVLCDQGPALKAVLRRHGNLRFLCLHHFLKSLNDPKFSVFVADLVRCRTFNEFKTMSNLMTSFITIAMRDNSDSGEISPALYQQA
jgi:hypothetical protein